MRVLKLFTGLTFLLIFSCTQNENRRIIIDNVFAEGSISTDTVYDGIINFYDTATNNLLYQATYKNGTLEGIRKEFYSNGKIKAELNYDSGKENGFTNLYDSGGNLLSRQYSYYSLRVGPSIQYKRGNPSKFRYYSFEKDILFYIDYDSVFGKKITDIEDEFYFFKEYSLYSHQYGDSTNMGTEYFIYLIDPPKYNFQYSLCIIDSKYSISKTIQIFKSAKVFDTFQINKLELEKDQKFAIRIEVIDSTNDNYGSAIMFQKTRVRNTAGNNAFMPLGRTITRP